MDTKDSPALINRAGEPVAWDALAAAVSGPFRSMVRSDDLEPVAVGVLQAFHHEGRVMLADPGAEVPAQGSPEPTGAGPPLSGRAGIMDLLAGNRAGRVGFLTSGTTGTPRVVHHGLPTLTRGVRQGPELATAVWGNGYHPAHMAGVQVLLQALSTGCPCVQLHGLEPPEILRRIREEGISHASATPGFFRFLLPALEAEKPVSGVRRLTLGGEAFDPSLAARLEEAFPGARVGNIYASTEAGSLFAAEGDCFRISPRLEGQVKVVDGELWLAAPLLGDLEITGSWYATGDQVAVVGENPLRIRFVGRTRTRLKVSGYPVHPEAVEAAIRRHPAIAETRVHGRPHPLVGHLLEAECVPAEGASLPEEAELRRFLARTCQPHEIPRIFRFVERIEKTPSGKARR